MPSSHHHDGFVCRMWRRELSPALCSEFEPIFAEIFKLPDWIKTSLALGEANFLSESAHDALVRHLLEPENCSTMIPVGRMFESFGSVGLANEQIRALLGRSLTFLLVRLIGCYFARITSA